MSGFAPDHFVISQFLLLLTLWLCSEKLKNGTAFNAWQTALLFVVTAGVTLSNGLKVFFAAFATRRGRFFRPGYLLLVVAIPCAIMWYVPRKVHYIWIWPVMQTRSVGQDVGKEQKGGEDDEKAKVAYAAATDTVGCEPSPQDAKPKVPGWTAIFKHPVVSRVLGGFAGSFAWVDVSSSRMEAAVHNLFGEAIQLHTDYALGDYGYTDHTFSLNTPYVASLDRPAIVKYSGAWAVVNYTVEAAIVLLFLAGVWCGRRSRFLWTAMSFFLFDMVLHLGLGFGINEVYIMSAHYLFVLPIATAYLLKRYEDNCKVRRILTGLVGVLALWCFVWNSAIIIPFLCG